MQSTAMSVLSFIRKILAILGVILLLTLGSHAFSQVFDKSAVRGIDKPHASTTWAALFTY